MHITILVLPAQTEKPGEPILVTHDLSAPSRDRFDSDEAYQNALIQHEAALKIQCNA